MKQPHILCEEKDVAQRVLLPGDPARVLRAAGFLNDTTAIAFNREFRTVSGRYKDVPVTITSTGIGGASAVIAVEELIACGAEYFIRIGSAGACQPGIALGDLILSTASVREDGASRMYAPDEYPAVPDFSLLSALVSACDSAGYRYHTGITRSHDSFYIDHEAELMQKWNSLGVLASDMETSALFTLASIRGVKAASILNNVVLYEGDVKEGVGDYVDEAAAAAGGETREIIAALEALIACD
ncbi:MAG: nucleoside phosphorylase [Spirochaetales bacterium]|uniref:Uridine phosphorylase n=1 Tax=Candidatus Thalassospirochaeta sargassi TaxID=3119039 RepID=A0AAJ1IEA7_9SPIO|nr:nucleoside phosphorylase [Spirochaetales bacterium]